ncbi:MAG: hypothetical protein MMC23_005174 [Stictis urceolatum]|nr:hypothetical protein [Stictis urceolata]
MQTILLALLGLVASVYSMALPTPAPHAVATTTSLITHKVPYTITYLTRFHYSTYTRTQTPGQVVRHTITEKGVPTTETITADQYETDLWTDIRAQHATKTCYDPTAQCTLTGDVHLIIEEEDESLEVHVQSRR